MNRVKQAPPAPIASASSGTDPCSSTSKASPDKVPSDQATGADKRPRDGKGRAEPEIVNADLASLNDEILDDAAWQAHILQGVSRTFALTIPQLPAALSAVVANAYLLCRIADTIEDEVALCLDQKRYFAGQFVAVVAGRTPAETFAAALYPLLTMSTIAAERELIRHSAAVIRVTHSFGPAQRAALERCTSIMGEGMAWFQTHQDPHGLPDLAHLDAYCYYVAGVVGEMLTELFCDYSADIAAHRETMLPLAVSFGQGLQMTNILKDIWEDRQRGACWLPRDVFRTHGFDLRSLDQSARDQSERYLGNPAFSAGLRTLIGLAHGHLRNALTYTLLIPKREQGMRKFCLWAIGMALLTLRKIHHHPAFTSGGQVKISRRSVAVTMATTNTFVASDRLLRLLFKAAAAGLPAARVPAQPGAPAALREVTGAASGAGLRAEAEGFALPPDADGAAPNKRKTG